MNLKQQEVFGKILRLRNECERETASLWRSFAELENDPEKVKVVLELADSIDNKVKARIATTIQLPTIIRTAGG